MMHFLLLLLILLVSCASRRVDLNQLHASGLPGMWEYQNGSYMKISCSGWIDYKIRETGMLFDDLKNRESHGDNIRRIEKDKFVSGAPISSPLPEETYKVSKWPTQHKDDVVMVVDDREWILKEKYDCSK